MRARTWMTRLLCVHVNSTLMNNLRKIRKVIYNTNLTEINVITQLLFYFAGVFTISFHAWSSFDGFSLRIDEKKVCLWMDTVNKAHNCIIWVGSNSFIVIIKIPNRWRLKEKRSFIYLIYLVSAAFSCLCLTETWLTFNDIAWEETALRTGLKH